LAKNSQMLGNLFQYRFFYISTCFSGKTAHNADRLKVCFRGMGKRNRTLAGKSSVAMTLAHHDLFRQRDTCVVDAQQIQPRRQSLYGKLKFLKAFFCNSH